LLCGECGNDKLLAFTCKRRASARHAVRAGCRSQLRTWWITSSRMCHRGNGCCPCHGLTQIDVDPTLNGIQSLQGGPEGFTCFNSGNAAFANNSLLLSEYRAGIAPP
jgi:hypothetical protein